MNETRDFLRTEMQIGHGHPPPIRVEESTGRTNFGKVHDLLNDQRLTPAEKRAILAFWASDIHAVEDAPAVRRLDDGTLVRVADLLDGLKAIDAGSFRSALLPKDYRRWRPSAARGARFRAARPGRSNRRRNSNGDDPPPCPGVLAVPNPPRSVDACAPSFGKSVIPRPAVAKALSV